MFGGRAHTYTYVSQCVCSLRVHIFDLRFTSHTPPLTRPDNFKIQIPRKNVELWEAPTQEIRDRTLKIGTQKVRILLNLIIFFYIRRHKARDTIHNKHRIYM